MACRMFRQRKRMDYGVRLRREGAGANRARGASTDIPDCFRSDFATSARVEIVDVCAEQDGSGKAYKDAAASAQLGAKPAQRVPIWLEPSQICNKANSRVLSRLAYGLRLAGGLSCEHRWGRRFQPACRRLEQGLMLFRYLHRGLNWPTIEALHLTHAA